ncbi:uncharacterized protein AB675_383 [Cyphellophora attinorum]|uniref:Transcription factor domain-containing protein n=1 Tax=Cyphellophora attinorum TaxID=1664694 RepID=A0A0N0NRT4_9EURO|nr:uncharacterized protein AB675_383 [Phialophora attinorum]KPI45461.1 hypothetical protein AB675_383 [Phialophora attinorum]
MHRIDLAKEQAPQLTNDEYSRWRDVWRAMIFLDTWLAMILGRTTQITTETSHDPWITHIRSELRQPEEDIAVNMARLAVVVGDYIQEAQLSSAAGSPVYERHLQALEEWSSALPQSLRVFIEDIDNVQQLDLPDDDEYSSLYLEAFYFSSVLLVTRPLLVEMVTTWRGQDDASIPHRIRFLAQTCTLNLYASLTLALNLSVRRTEGRWSLTYTQQESRRQLEINALDLSMGVLAYCAEQDVFSAGHLRTVNKFRTVLETQQRSEPAFVGTTLPTLGFDATPPTSFSTGASYHESTGSDQMSTSSVGFAAQPYSNTVMQLDLLSPVVAQYSSLYHTISSTGRSDSQSTNYSNPSDWMAAGPSSSDGQNAASMVDYFASPTQTTKQHYHPFLQDFYHYEELYSQGHAVPYN